AVDVPPSHGVGGGRRGRDRPRGEPAPARAPRAARVGARAARYRLELLLVPARHGRQLRRVLQRPRRDRGRGAVEGARDERRGWPGRVGAARAGNVPDARGPLRMTQQERREFVRTHRTAIFGYGRRQDGPWMTVVYYVM